MSIIDKIIDLALAYAHGTAPGIRDADSSASGSMDDDAKDGADTADGDPSRHRGLSAEAHAALRYTIARLATDFLSGPSGLASVLRTSLLDAPYNSASLPLDIGYAENISAHSRRAVILRDKHCAWPGRDRPLAWCDVHHIIHKEDGGKTSITNCPLLCQFHHDVCIHRWGWQIILHPDGTTEARGPRGPRGQILRSHAPPTGTAA